MQKVRSRAGTPTASDFSSADGSPLVQDNVSGRWYGYANSAVYSLGPMVVQGTNSAAFNAAMTALASGGVLVVPAGTYTLSTSVALVGNLEIRLEAGAVIVGNLTATSKENITIRGGTVQGGLTFTDCEGVSVLGVEVTQAPTMGIKFDGCSRSTVEGCHLHHNTSYGFEDEGGEFNSIFGNTMHDNGRPAAGNNLTGRGVVLWRSQHCIVANNNVYDNTEYGIRLYSVAAESVGARYNTISGNSLRDNGDVGAGGIEIYVYDDSGLVDCNKIVDNVIVKTVSRGQMIAAQGEDNEFSRNKMIAVARDQAMPGVVLYGANRARLCDNELYGVQNAFVFSGTVNPTNCELYQNKVVDVSAFTAQVNGTGHIIRRNPDWPDEP
jgi:parallel beta-helix repeat protein